MRMQDFIATASIALIVGAPVAAQDVREELVTIPAGAHSLAGTLTLPAGPPPYPTVIFISGSGPSDRDETLPGIPFQPFLALSEALTAKGIAVLRYDDRGVGGSTGDFASATTADFAEDAGAVLNYLRSRPETGPIGVLGHSEGGIAAAMVAVTHPEDVDFVVTLAGPAVTGEALLRSQITHIRASSNDPQIEAAMMRQERQLTMLAAGEFDELEADLHEQFAALPAAQQAQVGGEEAFVAGGMQLFRGWLGWFVRHDPAEDWRKVRQPVLALFGEHDTQVPATENAAALKAAAETALVEIVPRANHLFQAAETGEVAEYATLPASFAEGVTERIADWILEQTGSASGH